MKKIRIGLVGFSQGYYATKYTSYLAEFKNVELVGCCDLGEKEEYVRQCAFTTAKEFCEKLDAKLYHNFADLLEEGLDGVLVCSETADHADHIIQAMKGGAHVFVSKPLSFLSTDVKKVMEEQQRLRKLVLCGQPLRYEQGMIDIANAIKTGAVGKVTNVRVMLNHEAMVHVDWERNSYRSGGPLGTFGVYLFDIPLMLCGLKVVGLSALGETLVHSVLEDYDTFQIVARLENGALANLNLVSTVNWESPFVRVDIVGTDGIISGEYDNYTYRVVGKKNPAFGSLRTTDMGEAEAKHFLECLRGECEPCISLADMHYSALAIEAARESAGISSYVKLKDSGFDS